MSDEQLTIVPIPPLVNLLATLEAQKGTPLTESEVIAARDNAVCMRMPLSAATKLAETRGYSDIDPERVWEEWSVYREKARDR